MWCRCSSLLNCNLSFANMWKAPSTRKLRSNFALIVVQETYLQLSPIACTMLPFFASFFTQTKSAAKVITKLTRVPLTCCKSQKRLCAGGCSIRFLGVNNRLIELKRVDVSHTANCWSVYFRKSCDWRKPHRNVLLVTWLFYFALRGSLSLHWCCSVYRCL